MKKFILTALLYFNVLVVGGYILLGYLKLIATNTTALIVMGFFGIFTSILLGEVIGDERKNNNNKRFH